MPVHIIDTALTYSSAFTALETVDHLVLTDTSCDTSWICLNLHIEDAAQIKMQRSIAQRISLDSACSLKPKCQPTEWNAIGEAASAAAAEAACNLLHCGIVRATNEPWWVSGSNSEV